MLGSKGSSSGHNPLGSHSISDILINTPTSDLPMIADSKMIDVLFDIVFGDGVRGFSSFPLSALASVSFATNACYMHHTKN